MTKLEWEESRCPICGQKYSYVKGGYKPPTCSNFDCLYKYIHRPDKKGGDSDIQRRIDESRQRLGDKL